MSLQWTINLISLCCHSWSIGFRMADVIFCLSIENRNLCTRPVNRWRLTLSWIRFLANWNFLWFFAIWDFSGQFPLESFSSSLVLLRLPCQISIPGKLSLSSDGFFPISDHQLEDNAFENRACRICFVESVLEHFTFLSFHNFVQISWLCMDLWWDLLKEKKKKSNWKNTLNCSIAPS